MQVEESAFRSLGALLAAALLLSGCEGRQSSAAELINLPPPPTAQEVASASGGGASWTSSPAFSPEEGEAIRLMLTPTPAETVTITGTGGGTQTVRWASLNQTQIKTLLDQTDEHVTVEQINADGGVTFLSSGLTAKKGSYRVTYYYYRFRNQPCAAGSPGQGAIAVGIGVRVTAEIATSKAGINVSDLIPLAVAASREHLSGRMRAQSVGLTGGTGAISSYLEASGGVNADTIRKAVESFGVVKALLETTGVTLSPNYLFVESSDPQKCLDDLNTGGGVNG